MVDTQNALITAAKKHVAEFYEAHFSEKYVFHNFQHATEVVESTRQIAAGYALTDKEMEMLLVAAWFHDVGYVEGAEGHEERSCEYARAFFGGAWLCGYEHQNCTDLHSGDQSGRGA